MSSAEGGWRAAEASEPQWGGLPHAQIEDLEVRVIPGGYKVWMSCVSRGIAVLAVTTPLPGDVHGDGLVGILDFLALLAAWGPCPGPPAPCPADTDGDGSVGITDMLILLGHWS